MEWSQESTCRFLELFREESLIWDPKNKFHKNSMKVNDAWSRLSSQMYLPVADLKTKKNSLMATFRKHLRCKKQSIKSGAGADDIYQPIWPYFDIMEKFLASVYQCDKTLNTEDGQNASPPTLPYEVIIEIDEARDGDNVPNTADDNRVSEPVIDKLIKNKPPLLQARKRPHPEADFQKNINNTVANLNKILTQNKEKDECDIYAQLLANRLREYTKQERRQIMYKIDGFLLATPPQQDNSAYFNFTQPSTSLITSKSRNYVDRPDRRASHSSRDIQFNVTPVLQSQQSAQFSIPDHPSSPNIYVQQHPEIPIQISIPDFYPSQSTSVGPNVTILSNSQNILDKAYADALSDNNQYN